MTKELKKDSNFLNKEKGMEKHSKKHEKKTIKKYRKKLAVSL